MIGRQPMGPEVGADEARRLHADGHRILDVREPDEYAAGHVPGSLHIPLMQLPQRTVEVGAGDSWLVICRSGARSLQATRYLAQHGVDALNIAGGIIAWSRSGGEVRDARGNAGRVI